jgi:hypothetical protein
MFLRRIRERKLPEFDQDQLNQVDIVDFRDSEVIVEEPFAKTNNEIKKRGFLWAVNGRTITELFGEVAVWYNKQQLYKVNTSSLRIQFVQDQLDIIRDQVSEQKEKLETVVIIESELHEEKEAINEEINRLESKIKEIVSELGSAHTNLIKNRLADVKEELNALVEMYNSVFENKHKNEHDLKVAVNKQREICDEMIGHSKIIFRETSATLESSLKIGSTKFSAHFLLITGVFSMIAAGWFFSIFAESNDLTNQGWLFFTLSNLFNYLSIYTAQYGQFYAVFAMITSFLILLVIISCVAWVCELFISKLINNQSGFNFEVNLMQQKKTSFFKVKIRNGSFYSIWLKVLPRLLLIGILLIILSVGQTIGSDSEQIGELGRHLSSQVIGSTITLLFTGLFFLFIIKVIEPRKFRSSDPIDEKVSDDSKNRKLNKELWILIVVANVFLSLIILSQTADGFLANRKGLLAIFCFVLLANLTAFTLGYGIRQIGLIKTLSSIEEKILVFSNYRKALSGSKPIDIWILEEGQFANKFITIQRELFHLIQSKNKSLNQLNKLGQKDFFQPDEQVENRFRGFLRFRKEQHSHSQINKFYRYTFPEFSYQLEEYKNALNAKKRELEEVRSKIAKIREGRSELHFKVADELRRLKKTSDHLLEQRLDIESDKSRQFRLLHEEKLQIEQGLIEGYELGIWTKKNIL